MSSSTARAARGRAAKSPPTGRVMDVLATLSDSPDGRTSAELAKICGISTSTCALVLAELERRTWVTRREDRRYTLGSGLFGLVHGLRAQFPLLDRGRDALSFLHTTLGAGCSMSKIGQTHLITVDAVGHGTDGEHAVGQRFPIGPPFGLVAMAWRDDDAIDGVAAAGHAAADPRRHHRASAGARRRSATGATGPGGSTPPTPRCTTGSPRCSRRWSRPPR